MALVTKMPRYKIIIYVESWRNADLVQEDVSDLLNGHLTENGVKSRFPGSVEIGIAEQEKVDAED